MKDGATLSGPFFAQVNGCWVCQVLTWSGRKIYKLSLGSSRNTPGWKFTSQLIVISTGRRRVHDYRSAPASPRCFSFSETRSEITSPLVVSIRHTRRTCLDCLVKKERKKKNTHGFPSVQNACKYWSQKWSRSEWRIDLDDKFPSKTSKIRRSNLFFSRNSIRNTFPRLGFNKRIPRIVLRIFSQHYQRERSYD